MVSEGAITAAMASMPLRVLVSLHGVSLLVLPSGLSLSVVCPHQVQSFRNSMGIEVPKVANVLVRVGPQVAPPASPL